MDKIKDFIVAVSLIALICAIVMLAGIAGAVDTDAMTISDALRRGIVWLIIAAAAMGAIVLLQREDDPYGKL